MDHPLRLVAFLASLLLLLPVGACGDDPTPAPGDGSTKEAAAPPAGKTALRFEDVVATSGIATPNRSGRDGPKEWMIEMVGVGPSWLDYDGDGDLDLYVPDGDIMDNYELTREAGPDGEVPRLRPLANVPGRPRDQLWRNEGDGTFRDVAEAAGVADERWSFGATVWDYDADGDADVYVSNFGPNRLYRNNGDGTFTDVAVELGVEGPAWQWTTNAAVGDLDGDDRLDLYVAGFADPAVEVDRVYGILGLEDDAPLAEVQGRQCEWRGVTVYCGPLGLSPQHDILYLQQADGSFQDVTKEAGISAEPRSMGFTAVIFDFTGDGQPDIYVANDKMESFFWEQARGEDGTLRFRDTAGVLGVKVGEDLAPQNSMGVAVADINEDGLFDMFITNFSHDYNNIFLGQRGDAPGKPFFFRDRGLQVMGRESFYDLAWGCAWQDFENDGDVDLFVANGHVYKAVDLFEKAGVTYEQENALFETLDAPGMRFREIGAKAQKLHEGEEAANRDAGPGLAVKECSRGAAFGDYDNDGRMDVFVQNMNALPTLLHNVSTPTGHWVKFELRQPGGNLEALGSRLEVTAGGRTLHVPVVRVASFAGCNDPRLHVGLGEATTADVVVVWPDGERSRYTGLGSETLWRLDRAASEAVEVPLERLGGDDR